MGKKPEKTKEVSVAIAEASSAEGRHETETHNQIPRKRGRPRKIIKIEKSENQVEEPVGEDFEESDQYSKKVKISDQQVEQEEEEEEQRTEHRLNQQGSSASREILSRRSRRKSRPRKSS